jgi:single-stranded DNA-binding protein
VIDALVTGKLIKDPVELTGKTGQPFTRFMLNTPSKEGAYVLITGVAFGDVAERIARLHKGDALSVAGELSPTEWTDREGVEKHGLNVVVSAALSVYDIKKRRPKETS